MNALAVPGVARAVRRLRNRRGRTRLIAISAASLGVILAVASCSSSSPSKTATQSSSSQPGAASSTATQGGSILATAMAEVAKYYAVRTWATPTTGPKATPGKNIWWVSCGQQSPGCALDAAQAVEAGKVMGWNVTVFDGNFGLNDAYSKGVRQAVAAKADGVILLDIQCDVVKQALVEAKAAHIPVLNVQGPDCQGNPDLQTDYTYFPGYLHPLEYSYLSGQIMGYKAIAATNGKAHMLYYHIIGNEGSQQVSKGLQNVLGQCSDCSFKEIDVPLAQLSPGLAANVQSALLGNPNANAVAVPFASVFDVGLGAGLVRSGRHVVVISASQSPSFYNSIRQDSTLELSTLTVSSLQQSWGALDDMNRLLNGQAVVPQGGFIGLTDASHNLPPGGQDFDGPGEAQFFSTTFPYKATYTKIWKG